MRRHKNVTSFPQIEQVSLQINGKRVSNCTFLDNGSTASILDKRLEQKIQAKEIEVKLKVTGIQGPKNIKIEKTSITIPKDSINQKILLAVFPVGAHVYPSIPVRQF